MQKEAYHMRISEDEIRRDDIKENGVHIVDGVNLRSYANKPAPSEILTKEQLSKNVLQVEEVYVTSLIGERVDEAEKNRIIKDAEQKVLENPSFIAGVGNKFNDFKKLTPAKQTEFIKENIGDLITHFYKKGFGPSYIDRKRSDLQNGFKKLFEAELAIDKYLNGLEPQRREEFKNIIEETKNIINMSENVRDALLETKRNAEDNLYFPDAPSYTAAINAVSTYASSLLKAKELYLEPKDIEISDKEEAMLRPWVDIDEMPSSLYRLPSLYFSMKGDGLTSIKELKELQTAFKHNPISWKNRYTTKNAFEDPKYGFIKNDLFNKMLTGENLEKILIAHTRESEKMATDLIKFLEENRGFCYIDLNFKDSNFGTLFEHYRDLFPEKWKEVFDHLYLKTYEKDINIAEGSLSPVDIMKSVYKPYGEPGSYLKRVDDETDKGVALEYDFTNAEECSLFSNILASIPNEEKMDWLQDLKYLDSCPQASIKHDETMVYAVTNQIEKHPENFQFSEEELLKLEESLGFTTSIMNALYKANSLKGVQPKGDENLVEDATKRCETFILGASKHFQTAENREELEQYKDEYFQDMQGLSYFISHGQMKVQPEVFYKTITEKTFVLKYPQISAGIGYLIPDYGTKIEKEHSPEEIKEYLTAKEMLELSNITWNDLKYSNDKFLEIWYKPEDDKMYGSFYYSDDLWNLDYNARDPRNVN